MQTKKFAVLGVLVCLLANSWSVFAQQRGVGVRVKNEQTDKVEEVRLYKASYALVIGVSDYTNGWQSLPGVKDDVDAVQAVLREHGFQVTTVLSPKRAQLSAAIDKFISDHGYDYENRLLIYYAGHGQTQKSGAGFEQGFIVPADAPLPKAGNEAEFRRLALSMDTIERYAQEIEAKHVLFVFDSCFSGALITRTRSALSPIITFKATQPVRQFITAGTDDQEVPDVSVFRRQFVEGLKGGADRNTDGFVTGSELADYLQDNVSRYTRGAQTPQYGKIRDGRLDKGDFVFVSTKPAPVSNPAKQTADTDPNFNNSPVDPKAVEREAYRSIQNSNSIADIRAVLEEYPKSEYAAGARTKLEGLVWNSVKDSKDKVRIQKYLDEFPNGGNAPLARIELRKLNTPADNSPAANTAANTSSNPPSTQPANTSVTKSPAAVWAGIRETARTLTLLKYDYIYPFLESEELAVVRINWTDWGYIDKTGREVVPLKYWNAYSFSEGLAAVHVFSDGLNKHGFIDKTGRVVIPLKYDGAESFSEGLAVVQDSKSSRHGFINKTGRVIIPLKYVTAGSFSEGLAPVSVWISEKEKHGFIDKTGRVVIPLKYDNAWIFSEGLARVQIGGKWGFIDKTGREVIPPKYDYAESFSEGLAFVRVGDKQTGKEFYIDKTGREVFSHPYAIQGFFQGLSMVRVRQRDNSVKHGFLDKTGRLVIPDKYDSVWCEAFRKEGIIGVILNGKKGFVDIHGNEYFDF